MSFYLPLIKGVKKLSEIHLVLVWSIRLFSFVNSYTVFMQQGIKKDPTLVIKLRATFLKVSKIIFFSKFRPRALTDVESRRETYILLDMLILKLYHFFLNLNSDE